MAKCTLVLVLISILMIICCQIDSSVAKSSRVHTRNSQVHRRKPITLNRNHRNGQRYKPSVGNMVKNNEVGVYPVKRAESTPASRQDVPDILQSTFDMGFGRLFRFLRNIFVTRSGEEDGLPNEQQEEVKYKIPGFPTTSIFNSFNVTSIVKLLEAGPSDSQQLENLAEAAVVDTISQLFGIIGFNDLRDWLGIILMYFILGPIMIPLYWLPISLIGMSALLFPLFLHNPPSKLNTNVMGHDPLLPENPGAGAAAARNGEGTRAFVVNLVQRSLLNATESILLSQDENASTPTPSESNNTNNTTSQIVINQFGTTTTSIFEECMERVTCQFSRMYRANPVSKWLTSRLNATKIEWARENPHGGASEFSTSDFEDCAKYSCSIFPAVRSFISSWNSTTPKMNRKKVDTNSPP